MCFFVCICFYIKIYNLIVIFVLFCFKKKTKNLPRILFLLFHFVQQIYLEFKREQCSSVNINTKKKQKIRKKNKKHEKIRKLKSELILSISRVFGCFGDLKLQILHFRDFYKKIFVSFILKSIVKKVTNIKI